MTTETLTRPEAVVDEIGNTVIITYLQYMDDGRILYCGYDADVPAIERAIERVRFERLSKFYTMHVCVCKWFRSAMKEVGL